MRSFRASVLFVNTLLIIKFLLLKSLNVIDIIIINNIRANRELSAI